MNKQKKTALVPTLRFPEFQDRNDWDQDKVANLVTTVTPPKKLSTNLYQETGKYPIIDQSQNYICGWTNDKESLISDDLPLVIFGDHTCVLKITHEPFAQGADGIKILHADKQVKAEYLYQFLQHKPVRMEEYKRHFSILKEKIIGFPQKDSGEQQKIADCLSSVDELITLETQKLDTLKTHKKGLMQQLFPAEGETVPKLRFPQFRDAGEWEEKNIQELIDSNIIIGHLDGNHGELYPRSDEFSESGIPYISANDFANGSLDFSKCKHLPEQRAKLFKKGVAKNGDILFAHNATVGPVTKLKTNLDFVILSTTATYFRCDNHRLINDYLQFMLSSPLFVKQYTRVMKQSTRNQVPITTQRKFKLVLPKRAEQQKIADCLISIDEQIAAQSQKLDSLKMHKKGLMQQLFPALDEVSV